MAIANEKQPLISVFVYGTLKPNEANYQKYCAGKVIRETKAFTLLGGNCFIFL
jgi:gamma-glutamylcyclotransferase (GGCT)/AIG2-like uncharacterized protein YtfP